MEKKFKIIAVNSLGLDGIDYFETFEEAKSAFRERILSPEGIRCITELINSYAKEHYPENTPPEFGQLCNVLTKLATDPSYPQNTSKVPLITFKDENISFYIDEYLDIECFIHDFIHNKKYDVKFPIADIKVLKMDNKKEEYYFYLTEKSEGLCWNWDLTLSPVKNTKYDDDETFFDEDEVWTPTDGNG